MGVLDKIFGKKKEVQPPTIPVPEIPLEATEISSQMPKAPTPQEIMERSIARPMETQPIVPEPEIRPSLEDRFVEESAPKEIFVKLDRFGDVLSELTLIRSNLLNLKSLALNIEEVIDMLSNMDNLMKAYSEEMEKGLNVLEEIIEGVSSAAKRAKDVKYKAAKPEKSKAVEDIETKLKKLRAALKKEE